MSAKPAKPDKAAKPPKPGKGARDGGGKAAGDGTLTLWTVAYGVMFGGLWWLGWLAVQRAPDDDPLRVSLPYSLTAAALFALLIFNISEALARGARQAR